MGTLMRRVHALPGSTASNVSARGDYDSERRAVLTLREFDRILVAEVLGPYHNEQHTALGMTPAAKWADALSSTGGVSLPSDPAAFVLDFLPFEDRIVRREGVRLFNVTYYDGGLASLLDRPDRSCRVKYDPRDLSAVFVELPGEGHLRVPYADLSRPPVSLWEHRAAVQALQSNVCASRGAPAWTRPRSLRRSRRSGRRWLWPRPRARPRGGRWRGCRGPHQRKARHGKFERPTPPTMRKCQRSTAPKLG
jgi:hypothetical protein